MVAKISADQKKREKLENVNLQLIKSVTDGNSSEQQRSFSELNRDFLWSKLLTDVFLRMKYSVKDRNELIALCRLTYSDNKIELRKIDDFENNYETNNAVWWYTRDMCLYRMLNKALRTRDLDTLFAFRSFIVDLHRQLEQLYTYQHPGTFRSFITNLLPKSKADQSVIRQVYREHLMSKKELDEIKSNIGQYSSFNNFLSTKLDRNVAAAFVSPIVNDPDGLQSVLFEIDIDPSIANVKPFGNISSKSYTKEEGEVFFALGSIFKIYDIRQEDGIWMIKLQLASENESGLEALFQYIKKNETYKKHPIAKLDLKSLGEMLFQMGI